MSFVGKCEQQGLVSLVGKCEEQRLVQTYVGTSGKGGIWNNRINMFLYSRQFEREGKTVRAKWAEPTELKKEIAHVKLHFEIRNKIYFCISTEGREVGGDDITRKGEMKNIQFCRKTNR